METPTIVDANSVTAQKWRNGGGDTRELLVWPVGAASWQLRISLATITRDGPFSSYPGVRRWLAVVDGSGVRLHISQRICRMDTTTDPAQFSGDDPVWCELTDGPTSDLNMMTTVGRSLMCPAQAGKKWTCAMRQFGLFARTPGTLTASSGLSLMLPAHALLWARLDEHEVLRFDSGTVMSPAGIWLGFDCD